MYINALIYLNNQTLIEFEKENNKENIHPIEKEVTPDEGEEGEGEGEIEILNTSSDEKMIEISKKLLYR